MASIATALGIGSGIDTAALVTSLAQAARAPKDAALSTREAVNIAKISALGQATSAIDAFATSLGSLIGGGTLFTQPTSSDSSIVAASALPGARIDGLSATLKVTRLAQAQTNVSATFASASASVGLGTLSLQVGTKTVEIAITAANDSLTGLASAINAQKAGVSASVVTDTTGTRLVIKGATGAANGFTLTKLTGDDAGIGRFTYAADGTGGLTRSQPPLDAQLVLDGLTVTRPTNSISDLIDGVKLDLVKTSDTAVTLGSRRPTAEIKAAVDDFVTAYNTLESLLDAATAVATAEGEAGALAGDSGIRAMRRALGGLAGTALTAAGSGPKTLAEIGVRTQRDGSLKLDAGVLDAVLASDPNGVEALFNPSQRSSSPFVTISSAMGKAKPGTYALANLVPAPVDGAATGSIAGKSATGVGATLTAASDSPAAGLVVNVTGAVAEATVTVDIGLGGALQAIRDALRGSAGVLTSASTRYATESKAIAADRAKLETRSSVYRAQLESSFTAMERRMTLLKATQTQLTNQIALWNKSDS